MLKRRLFSALLAALLLLSAAGLAEPVYADDGAREDAAGIAAQSEDVEAEYEEVPSFDLGDPEPEAEPEPVGEGLEAGEPEEVPEAQVPEDGDPDEVPAEAPSEAEEAEKQPDALAEAAPAQATGLTAPKLSLTLGKGETAALNVKALPEGAAPGALSYASSKPKVASVTADGRVRGVKKGKATITVTSDAGLKLTLSVKVMAAPKKVKLKLAKRTLGVGEAMAVACKLTKKTGGGRTYSVDAGGVLRYDEASGTVVGVKSGVGTLTVRTYNNKTASAKITVLPAPASLTPSAPAIELVAGGKASFTAALPRGTMASIRYESSNPGVAKIDGAGKVTGVAGGTATLTATAHNGVSCQCLAYVLPKPSSFALKSRTVELLVGESYAPEITTVPADACKTLRLSTKNKKIVSVKNGVVKAKKKGKAKVVVKTVNGLKATLTVKVVGAPNKIRLNTYSLSLAAGQKATLGYTFQGGRSTVTFTSSNPAVAAVDAATGEVTGVAAGTARVTAKTLNGKIAIADVYVDTQPADEFRVTYMNIGRNDGILMCCQGEYAFIDSGVHEYGLKAVKYIRSQGITHLKYYIASHAHADHIGGAGAILAALDVETVLVPHRTCISCIKNWAEGKLEKAAAKAVKYRVIKLGEVISLGSAKMRVVGPVKVHGASPMKSSENVNSLILNITHGANSFLMTGDATEEEIMEVHKHDPGCLNTDVLKNPHHNGEVRYIVTKSSPKITVFSTTKNRLPKADFVNWIKKQGSAVYITSANRHSHVTVTSDGTNLTVRTARTP